MELGVGGWCDALIIDNIHEEFYSVLNWILMHDRMISFYVVCVFVPFYKWSTEKGNRKIWGKLQEAVAKIKTKVSTNYWDHCQKVQTNLLLPLNFYPKTLITFSVVSNLPNYYIELKLMIIPLPSLLLNRWTLWLKLKAIRLIYK